LRIDSGKLSDHAIYSCLLGFIEHLVIACCRAQVYAIFRRAMVVTANLGSYFVRRFEIPEYIVYI